MPFNCDSAFVIGAAHRVCQDYATAVWRCGASPEQAGVSHEEPFVLVSDGCSSSLDTDLGARLLVQAARRRLSAVGGGGAGGSICEIHSKSAREALAHARMIGLEPQAIDATLLTIHLDGGAFVAAVSGDGVFAAKSRSGEWDVYSVAFASGYPLYPAYAHQPERLRLLEENGARTREVTHFHAGPAGALQPRNRYASHTFTEVFTGRAEEYEFLAVLTDGAHSFSRVRQTETSRSVEALALDQILPELLAFKTAGGMFVSRRLKRFEEDCRRLGWRHGDDLALGVIHLGS